MANFFKSFGQGVKENFKNDYRYAIPPAERILDRILNPFEDVNYRVPFVFTSDQRIQKEIPPVRMKMNPESVTFSQAKRITRRDTQAGAVFFHWTNAKGRNNDVINVNFSGSTGNISLRTGAQNLTVLGDTIRSLNDKIRSFTQQEGLDIATLGGASKIVNFWNLYSLTAEPVLDPTSNFNNRFYFMYTSPLLGNAMITFIGHFDKVLEFTDDANNPFSKNYTFSFVATETIPSMDDIFKYVSASIGDQFFSELAT
jgi:hypothetical protein